MEHSAQHILTIIVDIDTFCWYWYTLTIIIGIDFIVTSLDF